MERIKRILDHIVEFFAKLSSVLDVELFSLGESVISFGTLIYLFFSIALLIYISGYIKKIVTNTIVKRYDMNPGNILSIASLSRYIVLIIGSIVLIQSAGVDLSALSIIFGALGVGIGFGLQGITNNWISGLIILFEQPIKVGDRVNVNNIEGNVIKISARATTVNTNDNITLIIPNSEFINGTVINWSHNDKSVGLRFPVGVSYKEDPERVKTILLEVLKKEPGVLNKPEPQVLFDSYGDSSLNFNLRIWTNEYADRPLQIKSALYFRIFDEFRKQNIEIPFPQRDIHIKNS